jgi:hypothetical protein
MKSFKRPDKISGLKIWLDASDESTVNFGRVSNLEQVTNFQDKISGIQLRNIISGQGPTYSFRSVNGKNAISMQPQYSFGAEACNTALGATAIMVLNSSTCSMFCVYKPTDIYFADANGNQKHVLNILDLTSTTSGLGIANRSIYVGDEVSPNASTSQRANPSGRYAEANTSLSSPYTSTTTYNEHIPSRNEWSEASTSLNKMCMTLVRSQSGLKKIGFMTETDDFIDDFTAFKYAPDDRGIKLTGPVYSPGLTASMVIGAYRPVSYTVQANYYPFVGFFCEFLYYDRFLTEDEANSVKQYLKLKWF